MRNLINRALAAKKQHLLTHICALCALIIFVPTSVRATDYTIEPGENAASYALPVYMGEQGSASSFYGSITQCIFLASELLDDDENPASEGDVTDITFYYTAKDKTSATGFSRSIEIYLMEIDPSINEYAMVNIPYEHITYGTTDSYYSYFLCNVSNKAGQKVFDDNLITEDVSSGDTKEVKLTLSPSFHWDGSKNIVMTVVDKSATTQPSSNLRFWISSTKVGDVGHPRFAYTFWKNSSDERVSWISDGNYNFSNRLSDYYGSNTKNNRREDDQKKQRSYVPKTTFTIESSAAPTAPSTPENLSASNVGANSASLSWSAVDGATSYNLYYSTSGEGIYDELASPATNSYNWTGLTASTTYYVKVAAVNGAGTSDYSEPISFTTQAPHIHDGITFEPWSNPSAMPTSGNYYLNTEVELASDWNVTENINLCLNGHEVYTETNSIQVKDGATFAIYDNEGGGRIYGYFVANYPKYGLINIENGGTLVLSEGTIQNLYGSYEEDDDPDDKSLSNAIYNNGTLKLSGALTFTSYHADIYLGSNKYITIESEKPLTNSEPYSVYKSGKSVITSGWANMNGADPKDYFVSANTSLNIKMGETEAEFYPVISLSENNTNTAIGTYSGQMVDVKLTRSLTSSQYNTFCLPFALDDDQLKEFFGAGYDLEEFVSSSLEGDVLNLVFNKVTSLEAGKPYLLQPSVDVANPSFEGVTIAATEPADQTSDANISFHATFAPTELEGGNKNLLFLGAENELFYPASTANIKAFRAYFELKGTAKLSAPKARIVKKQDSATGIENQKSEIGNHKFLKDGQLYILREGKMYNVLGMEK